jgi:hypothetical protein
LIGLINQKLKNYFTTQMDQSIEQSFAEEIELILRETAECHHETKQAGELNVHARDALLDCLEEMLKIEGFVFLANSPQDQLQILSESMVRETPSVKKRRQQLETDSVASLESLRQAIKQGKITRFSQLEYALFRLTAQAKN